MAPTKPVTGTTALEKVTPSVVAEIEETRRAPLAEDEIGNYPEDLNPFEHGTDGKPVFFYLTIII